MSLAVRTIAADVLTRKLGILIMDNRLQKRRRKSCLSFLIKSLFQDPFEPSNQRALLPFLKQVKQQFPHKNIWCYTGYLLDQELWRQSRARCEVTEELLSLIDVLVDGEFVQAKKNISLAFRGSENQRLIDMAESNRQGRVCLYQC